MSTLRRAVKAQSCWKARSSRAASGIRSLRRRLKSLDFEKSITGSAGRKGVTGICRKDHAKRRNAKDT